MDRATVTRVVHDFIGSRGELPEDPQARNQCAYIDEGLVDSMSIVDMVVTFESELGIALEPEHLQADQFRTVGGLIDLLCSIDQREATS